MNVILALLGQIMAIAGPIISVLILYLGFKKIDNTKEDVIDELYEFKDKALEFYAKEKTDIFTGLPEIISKSLHAPVMSQLGKLSGESRQLKALEKELMKDGVTHITGNPALGGLVAKYAQKYPIVTQLFQMYMANKGKNNGGPPQPSTNKFGRM